MLDDHPELAYKAVKVYAMYDSLARDRHGSLVVAMATSGMELTDTLVLKAGARRTLHLPSLPTKALIYATGSGCATVQGKVSYSTYAVHTTTADLLALHADVVQEIQPDRSSVEEIEGKLPMLKLRTCFRWLGAGSSGVLRMEVELFSGFELSTTSPPQLIDLGVDMSVMQHGYLDNRLWFIFANVSTSCPVCVQYLTRSVFVVTSLRPAYARIYPAGRQDLAAETFFHTGAGSNLLKSITEDDMITWFGKNRTGEEEDRFFDTVPEKCAKEFTSTSSSTTATSTTTTQAATTVPPKLQIPNVSTYTINVDGGDNSTRNESDNDSLVLLTTPSTPAPVKTKYKKVLTPKSKVEKMVVNKNVSAPKHVNTAVRNLPANIAKPDKSSTEEDAVTFAPESKNDEYVLVNKDELWGMLKEVVDDRLKKSKISGKTGIDDGKLRNMEFT